MNLFIDILFCIMLFTTFYTIHLYAIWSNQFSLTKLHQKGKLGQLNYVQTEITSAAFFYKWMQINV